MADMSKYTVVENYPVYPKDGCCRGPSATTGDILK